MRILSKPYGEIEIDERQIIEFPSGILGFEDQTRWALLDSTQPPFYWLQSLRDSKLAFVLIDPTVFRPEFRPELSDSDRESLRLADEPDMLVFAIVTIPVEQTRMTANLQGPVILNKRLRIGRQTIQTGGQWKVRHTILEEMASLGAR